MRKGTNQDSYHRIVIWIISVVRHRLDQLEQVHDEAIIHLQQILGAQVLDTRHLVHQLQQQPVQAVIAVRAPPNELEQPRKTPLANHATEGQLPGPAVEKKKVGDDVERRELVLLQEAVDDLRPDIVAVLTEDLAG